MEAINSDDIPADFLVAADALRSALHDLKLAKKDADDAHLAAVAAMGNVFALQRKVAAATRGLDIEIEKMGIGRAAKAVRRLPVQA